MLRLVLFSLMAAAVIALPTFPDLHQIPQEKDAIVKVSRVTEILPGQEPKQTSDVRLLKDGESIPIEHQQSKRQALDVDLSKRQDPGKERLQNPMQEGGLFELPSEFERRQERLSEHAPLRSQQSKRQTNPGEELSEKQSEVPIQENDKLNSELEEKQDETLRPIARLSILRTIIVFLNPVKSDETSEDVPSMNEPVAESQPTKESEQDKIFNQPLEQQPDLRQTPTVGVQKRQSEQQVKIPTSQSGLLYQRQQQQQQQQPQLRIRKRRQIRNPSSFEPFSSNVDIPRKQDKPRKAQRQKDMELHQIDLPLERNARDIFQPASTIPKLPQEQQEQLRQKVDDQGRLDDKLPSSQLRTRSIIPHHVGSQDPSPLMKGAGENLRGEMDLPQQDTEPSEKLQPYVEQLESLIGFMEKTKEHVQQEAHQLPSSSLRKRRDEPFPSVLIPPRLIEQKENIQQKESEPGMRKEAPEMLPEKAAEPLPEVPEEKLQPEQPMQEKQGKELELPKEEKDFREILESTPQEMLDKGKEKTQDVTQPIEEKFEQGKEKLGDLTENVKPEEQSPAMEKGKERVSDAAPDVQNPVAQEAENVEKNLPDVKELKESLPDIQKGGRESHGKSINLEEAKPEISREHQMPESPTPQIGGIAKSDSGSATKMHPTESAMLPTETPMAPDIHHEEEEPISNIPESEDARRGKELTAPEIQSPIEKQTSDQDLRRGKELQPQASSPLESEHLEDRARGNVLPQSENQSPLRETIDLQKEIKAGEESQPELQRPGDQVGPNLQQEGFRSGKELTRTENLDNEPAPELRMQEKSGESRMEQLPSDLSGDRGNSGRQDIQDMQTPLELPQDGSSRNLQPEQKEDMIPTENLRSGKELSQPENLNPIPSPNIQGKSGNENIQTDRLPEELPSPVEVQQKQQKGKEMTPEITPELHSQAAQ